MEEKTIVRVGIANRRTPQPSNLMQIRPGHNAYIHTMSWLPGDEFIICREARSWVEYSNIERPSVRFCLNGDQIKLVKNTWRTITITDKIYQACLGRSGFMESAIFKKTLKLKTGVDLE